MGLFGILKKNKKPKENPSGNDSNNASNYDYKSNRNIGVTRPVSSSSENYNVKTNEKPQPDYNPDNSSKHNFSYLNDLINSNEPKIILDHDIILDSNEESLFKDGILIDMDDLIIDGAGFTIDARKRTRIFHITAKNVTLTNINFKNGFSDKGGSIFNEGVSLEVKDCYFENNYANNLGGGILNYAKHLSLTKCNFNENGAKWHGGAIYNNGDLLNVSGCNFKRNSADGNAAAIFNKSCECEILKSEFYENKSLGISGSIYNDEGNIFIADCIFKENFAKKYAGAIYNNNSISLENTEFAKNSSKIHGGAIYNISKLKFKNSCIFEDNVSLKQGGAIYNEDDSEIYLVDSTFTNNNSNNSGGAIYNKGLVNLKKSFFIRNSTKRDGGAIYNESILECNECDFQNNHANKTASTILNNDYVNILNSTFENNDFGDESFIVMMDDENNKLNIENSSFLLNSIENRKVLNILEGFCNLNRVEFDILNCSQEGFVICNDDGELNLSNVKFNGYSVDEEKLAIDKKLAYNNSILKYENVKNIEKIIVEGPNSQLKPMNDTIPSNFKGFSYLDDLIQTANGEIELDHDIIMHESEKDFYEGGIEIGHNDLTIDGNNHIIDAANLSRIFIITGGKIVLKNIRFKNGKYFYNPFYDEFNGGGAIISLHDALVSVINCQFLDNESKNSAGSIFSKGEKLEIENSTFISNSSSKFGGAIYNKSPSLTIKDNCIFENNRSVESGGALYNAGDSCCIENQTRFLNNSSNECGGAIYDSRGVLSLADSYFKSNASNWFGGAIDIVYDELLSFFDEADDIGKYEGNLIFENCVFDENIAVFGGAIYHTGNLTLNDCTFNANESKSNAGAIFTLNNGYLSLDNCKFIGNHSTSKGGAVYSSSARLKAYNNCIFENNYSTDGGAIYYMGRFLNLDGCSFKSNSASPNDLGSGGAISKSGSYYARKSSVNKCDFEDNKAKFGAGIYISETTDLDLFDCRFNDNYAPNGDSINNNGLMSLNNCEFKASHKNILLNNGEILKKDNSFDNNCKIINKRSLMGIRRK